MQKFRKQSHRLTVTGMIALIVFLITAAGCKKNPTALKDFTQVNLVANNDEYSAARIDTAFINGWGIAFGSTGVAWVSVANPGLSEVWDNAGNVVIPAVTIPGAGGGPVGHPSGQVFNSTADFNLPNGSPAKFIFAGLDGVISGWNGGPAAVTALDDSKSGAVYTGITIASDGEANFVYTANFGEGKIDVYDKNWEEIEKPFKDPAIPDGYAPFNVQNVGGMLYVMYAKVGTPGKEETGSGKGYVDVYNTNGTLAKHFAAGGVLNAPWGIAQAPDGFFDKDIEMGNTHNAILVGNFGDGHINVYNESGQFIGPIRSKQKPLVIDGLWGIAFPPASATADNPNWLYFAAGPDDEEDGLFGYITK